MDKEKDKLEYLEHHPAFIGLTEKQKKFLRKYLETGGDKIAAFKAAGFNSSSDNSRDVLIHRVLANENIRALIGEYFGFKNLKTQLQKDELLGILSAEIRSAHAKGTSLVYFVPLLKLYVEVKQWVAPTKQRWTASTIRKGVTEGQKVVEGHTKKSAATLLDLVQQLENKGDSDEQLSKGNGPEEARQESDRGESGGQGFIQDHQAGSTS